jgi:hypothetical protein
MRGGSASNILVSGTLLSIFLLLGSLTYVSSDLSRIAMPTTASRTASFPPGLHNLTFLQSGDGSGYLPWSITLSSSVIGNLTEVNPTNATIVPWSTIQALRCSHNSCSNLTILDCSGYYRLNSCSGPILYSDNQSVATVSFLVPYGSYSYEVVTEYGALFGQVDFSPSNPLPVGINVEFAGVTAGG